VGKEGGQESLLSRRRCKGLQESQGVTQSSKMNPMIIERDVITIADIDEAIAHLAVMLKDRYGNRLTHQRKAFLMSEMDSLLDARLEALNESNNNPE
jgi:hypothetical protein